MIQLELEARQIDLIDIAKLVNSSLPVDGTLAANVHIHGTALNPIGHGNISLTTRKDLSAADPLRKS